MKEYKSIKIHERSYKTIDQIRERLKEHCIYLNKSQTLQYAINQLKNTLEKINKQKHDAAK